jgi:acetyl/propionyl-CoA carboxylase alpha subunit
VGFLERLLHHPKVIQGDFTTHFIETEMVSDPSQHEKSLAKAIAAFIYHRVYHQENEAGDASKWVVVEDKEGFLVKISGNRVVVGKKAFDLDLHWQPRERRFTVGTQGQFYHGQVFLDGMNLTLRLLGVDHKFLIMRPKVWSLFSHVRPPDILPDNLIVKAPMPGIVVSLSISVGDRVKVGQTLLVIEAMKMENALKSPAEAIVTDILVHLGDSLSRNQVLVKLE